MNIAYTDIHSSLKVAKKDKVLNVVEILSIDTESKKKTDLQKDIQRELSHLYDNLSVEDIQELNNEVYKLLQEE